MDYSVVVLLCGLAILAGAVVQGLIGLGMALVATPVVTLVDHTLVPGTLILISIVLPVLTLVVERDDIDWRGLFWAFPFRFAGTAVGTWLVVIASPTLLAVMVAVVVLGSVLLSLVRWKPEPTPRAISVGAFISGVSGTATSIGGPPIALVYQHQRATMIRSTLAVYFLISSTVSVTTLAVAGKVTTHHAITAAWMLPFVVLGFAIAMPIRRWVDAGRVRGVVLAVSAASATFLLLRALLG